MVARRPLVVGVACALLAEPRYAAAQSATRAYRLGLLATTTPVATWRTLPAFEAFLDGLHKLGYVEGRDVVFDYRSAEGEWQRLPDLALELARLKVDVIVVPVCGAVLDAARGASRTIPIVVQSCSDDMVATGIVASLARPGGNVTGLSKLTPQLAGKQLELLKEVLPKLSRVAVLWDPGYLDVTADLQDLGVTARRLNVTLQPTEAHGREQLAQAFATMVTQRAEAVITFSDATTYNYPGQIAQLAIEHRLPMISSFREVVDAGGLLSYGPNIPDMWRRSAGYVDKILKGAKPAEIPIEQPVKFELLINLKTSRRLGISVPRALLLRADQVIE